MNLSQHFFLLWALNICNDFSFYVNVLFISQQETKLNLNVECRISLVTKKPSPKSDVGCQHCQERWPLPSTRMLMWCSYLPAVARPHLGPSWWPRLPCAPLLVAPLAAALLATPPRRTISTTPSSLTCGAPLRRLPFYTLQRPLLQHFLDFIYPSLKFRLGFWITSLYSSVCWRERRLLF